METLGSLIESYEAQNIPEIEGSPSGALKTRLKEVGLYGQRPYIAIKELKPVPYPSAQSVN
jgi:hypothetical protein